MSTVTKAQFGAISRYSKVEINNAEQQLAADPIDPAKLQTILTKLNRYDSRVAELREQLLPTLQEEEVDAEVDKHEKLKADLIDAIAKLETCIALQYHPRSEQGRASSQISDNRGPEGGPTSSVKLPKLNIPPFDGDPLKFQEFWDAFESTIHSNEALTPVEKLNYLLSYLRGSAKNPIAGYSLIAANYSTVISVLKQRFGNKELIIYNHLDSLISLPPTGPKVSDLQRTTDECERHIRSLVNLGLEEDTFGRVFVPIIMSKLPTGIRISLHKKQLPGHCWSLGELRETLQQEIYAREMGSRSFGTGSTLQSANRCKSQDQPRWRMEEFKRKPDTASTLTSTSAAKPGATNKKKCRFCGDEHYNTVCRRFPDSSSRRSALGDGCFNCLGRNHTASICRSKRSCYYCKSNRHHSSLCNKQFGLPRTAETTSKSNQLKVESSIPTAEAISHPSSPSKVTATVFSHGKRGILQTAKATIVGPSGSYTARILFDNGASNAFLTIKAATKIGAKRIGKEVVALAGFQDKSRKSTVYPVYEVGIKLRNGSVKRIQTYGTDVITCAIERHRIDTEQHPLLAKLELADPLTDKDEEVEVDLLVGSDYYYDFVKTERITLETGLVLLDSELGYIVAGRMEGKSPKTTQLLLTKCQCPDSNFDLERLWKLEEVGIREQQESIEDESAVTLFNKTVSFNSEEGRYYVKWPLKQENPELPGNFKLAQARLKSLATRLQDNIPIFDKFNKTISEQQSKNIIELAPTLPDGQLVHYIPHHGVLTPDKTTTKLRIVYDASSRLTKTCLSLNDCMHRGPVMLQDLCGLLIRFRMKPIAMVSDIEKAFLQIGLHKEDRDLVRFLWLKDPTQPYSRENILHFRFTRVCFGVIASPFLLAAVIAHHLQRQNTSIAADILRNIYVDNVITGAASVTEATEYYSEAKKTFKSASMNLREWYSNDEEFVQQIPFNDRGEGTSTKVLGMKWDLKDDKLSLPVKYMEYNNMTPITKRTVLRSIAKIFDPCGFFAPITISGKLMLQQLWQKKYAWDDPLPEDVSKAFREQSSMWNNIREVKLDRFIGQKLELKSARVELHCFCDASVSAYSAVLYLRTTVNAHTSCNLVFTKARVSPLKSQTVPRLELMAVYIGTKLLSFVEKELQRPVDRKIIWSDSQCALHWITGKPVSTRFVKNRVETIREHKDIDFKYVPTKENPADLPTRGTTFQLLCSSTSWWKGPLWLQKEESEWPSVPDTINTKKQGATDDKMLLITETVSSRTPWTPAASLVDIDRLSSFNKAIKTVGYVKRFCRQIAKKTQIEHVWLTAAERNEATDFLIREAQGRHKLSGDSTFNNLGLHTDMQGIVRCSTRLRHADLPESAKRPILLPHSDRLTSLIIEDCHVRLLHAGVKHTLAELRYRYWIIRGRSAIKKVLRQCISCKRQRGKPYQAPQEPPLPPFRVMGKRAYMTVGIDFLGPLLLHPPKSEPYKAWLCLFTCALTRAVHLEIVTNMSAETFLLAFRRFAAVWGFPEIIVTDNAKQFHSAKLAIDRRWQTLLSQPLIQEFAACNRIDWKFIVERAPWMGGFYERMVGLTKSSLKSAIHRKHLDLPELQTVVCEITAVINSRPLVYSEEEVGDHPLTPAHLTWRHWSLSPMWVQEEDDPDYDPPGTANRLIVGWKRIQRIVDEFWKAWSRQYLTSLREKQHTNKQQNKGAHRANMGDVVLVGDKNLPRGRWKIGRITHLNTSADGRIRSATVHMPGARSLTRSVTMLYPLEIPNQCPEFRQNHTSECSTVKTQSASESEPLSLAVEDNNLTVESESIPQKSQRRAAITAKARIKMYAESEGN